MTHATSPLFGPAPAEVPLPDAPLRRVIAQVRFSTVLAVQSPEHIAPFQEAIRSDYPVLTQEHTQSLFVGPEGVASGRELVAWRFTSADAAWRASLTPEFVALETGSYRSRSDFLARFGALLEAVQEFIDPAVVQRIGMRYIAQVTGDALPSLPDLVRPELLSLAGTPLFAHVHNALGEAQMEAPEETGQLRLRWGHLAGGASVDPNALPPLGEPSWILDIDMSREGQAPFEAELLGGDLERFAERLYAMFRWSVTDEFLEHFGGKP